MGSLPVWLGEPCNAGDQIQGCCGENVLHLSSCFSGLLFLLFRLVWRPLPAMLRSYSRVGAQRSLLMGSGDHGVKEQI